jgi:hypothetical protein
MKHDHFGEMDPNTLIVLKCGAEEGWRRSVGLIVPKCISMSQGAKEHSTYNRPKES